MSYLTPVGVVSEVAALEHALESGGGLRGRGERGVRRPDRFEVVAVVHLGAVAVGEVARRLVQPGVDDLPENGRANEWMAARDRVGLVAGAGGRWCTAAD